MSMIAAIVALGGFTALAYWKPHPITFELAAGLSAMTGFYWYDNFENFAGLSVTLVLLGWSLTMLGFGLWQMFANRSEGKE